MTDGLADAKSAAWDASGKYLWFLASTNFGPTSGWLDMTSYDHPVTAALYLTVLKKGGRSPLLPESAEGRAADSTRAAATPAGPGDSVRTSRAARPTVSIDVDGLAQRTLTVPGIAQRPYRDVIAGPAGTVFWLETVPSTATTEPPPGQPAACAPLHRYLLKDRKAAH